MLISWSFQNWQNIPGLTPDGQVLKMLTYYILILNCNVVKNIDAQTKIEGWFHVGIMKKHFIIYITDITASPKPIVI